MKVVDEVVKIKPGPPENLLAILDKAALDPTGIVGDDPEEQAELQRSAIALVEALCDPIEAVHALLPEGHEIVRSPHDSPWLKSLLRSLAVVSGGPPEPGSHGEFIPSHLKKRANIQKRVVYETQLWVRGTLSNINSIVIKPETVDRPLGLIAGRFSANSVDRWCRVVLDPPVHDETLGEVMTRPTKKRAHDRSYHCFARILCFNHELELNDETKFDIAVDKDRGTYILEPKVYKRTFVGKPPKDNHGRYIEVAIGIGNDWYQVPIRDPSGRQELETLLGRLDCDTISAKAGLRMSFDSFLRYPQNHDYLMTWEGNYNQKNELVQGAEGQDGDGGNDGGNDGDDPGNNGDDNNQDRIRPEDGENDANDPRAHYEGANGDGDGRTDDALPQRTVIAGLEEYRRRQAAKPRGESTHKMSRVSKPGRTKARKLSTKNKDRHRTRPGASSFSGPGRRLG